MNILDGNKIKQEILDTLKTKVCALEKKPTLCVIQIGNDQASNVYISQKEKMCDYIGFEFIHKKLDENTPENEIVNIINELNNNEDINGILVQMPLPTKIDAKKIQNTILPIKDVDGLNDTNIVNLINNNDGLFPCTACGVINLLDKYEIPVEGSDIVIVGRSFLVGIPLFHMLNNKNATVTLCHSKTKNLKEKTSKADILIVATGQKHLIKEDMIKENATIIDVGITKENGILYGDVDFVNVKDKVSSITPVPGGVGPMTIAMLAENVLKAYQKQKGIF